MTGQRSGTASVTGLVEVLAVSALENEGIAEVLQKVIQLDNNIRDNGILAARRAEQSREWLWQAIRETLFDSMPEKALLKNRAVDFEQEVSAGRMTASLAARRFVNEIKGHRSGEVS